VLGHSDFGPGDRFSDVGGDSLAALNLALELGRISERHVGVVELLRFPTVADQAQALEQLVLGRPAGLPGRDRFHGEWMRIETPQARRAAWIHPGGYSSESDVWLVGGLLSAVAVDTSLLVVRTNIADSRIAAPETFSDVVDPLFAEMAAHEGQRPLLIGVCLGALVMADLAGRLKAAGRTDLEMVLLDPWIPGMGRSAAGLVLGDHPEHICRYYDLFKEQTYGNLPASTRVILAGEDSHFEERKRFWSNRVCSESHIHVVRGDHLSFLRAYRNDTARLLTLLVRNFRPS
jgi:hypothetical protein